MYETIRPKVIFKALNYLINTPLYIKHKIKIDEKFFKRYENHEDEIIEFIIDYTDKDDEVLSINSDNNVDNYNNNENTNEYSLINEFSSNENNTKNVTKQDCKLEFDFSQINNDEVLLMDRNAEATN